VKEGLAQPEFNMGLVVHLYTKENNALSLIRGSAIYACVRDNYNSDIEFSLDEIVLSNSDIMDLYDRCIYALANKAVAPDYLPICNSIGELHTYDSLYYYNVELTIKFLQPVVEDIIHHAKKYELYCKTTW